MVYLVHSTNIEQWNKTRTWKIFYRILLRWHLIPTLSLSLHVCTLVLLHSETLASSPLQSSWSRNIGLLTTPGNSVTSTTSTNSGMMRVYENKEQAFHGSCYYVPHCKWETGFIYSHRRLIAAKANYTQEQSLALAKKSFCRSALSNIIMVGPITLCNHHSFAMMATKPSVCSPVVKQLMWMYLHIWWLATLTTTSCM